MRHGPTSQPCSVKYARLNGLAEIEFIVADSASKIMSIAEVLEKIATLERARRSSDLDTSCRLHCDKDADESNRVSIPIHALL